MSDYIKLDASNAIFDLENALTCRFLPALTEAIKLGIEAGTAPKVVSDPQVLTCAFCGQSYPPGTPPTQHEALTAHVRTCEKHPLFKALAFIQQISDDSYHGCTDGSCPHGHANECLTVLVKLIVDRGEEARKLLE